MALHYGRVLVANEKDSFPFRAFSSSEVMQAFNSSGGALYDPVSLIVPVRPNRCSSTSPSLSFCTKFYSLYPVYMLHKSVSRLWISVSSVGIFCVRWMSSSNSIVQFLWKHLFHTCAHNSTHYLSAQPTWKKLWIYFIHRTLYYCMHDIKQLLLQLTGAWFVTNF